MRDPRMEAFVQQVRAQTDILAVVQGYVPLKRKGNRYWGCCPFHRSRGSPPPLRTGEAW